MFNSVFDILYSASTWVVPVLLAVILHELAHGIMADKLGDPTARLAGRLTLNPVRHIDPFGTVVLPGLLIAISSPFMFGWARPVPVDCRNLSHPRQGMALIAAAGPGMNVALAFVSFVTLRWIVNSGEFSANPWWLSTLWNSVYFNLVLAVFNMMPILPLDGGRIVAGLLPENLALSFAKLERFGFGLLLVFLIVFPLIGQKAGIDLNFLSSLIRHAVQAILGVFIMMVD